MYLQHRSRQAGGLQSRLGGLLLSSVVIAVPLTGNGASPAPGVMADAHAPRALDSSDAVFRSGFDEQWIDVTGTGFWQCNANCMLVDGRFVESGAGMTINAVGTWVNGLRPLAVRVEASKSPLLQLGVGLSGGGIDFAYCENYVVTTPCPVRASADIQRMNLYQSGRIDRIEFLIP